MKNTIAVIAAVACIHACAGFSRLLPLAPHSRSASALVPLRRLATQMTEDEAVADAALVARIDAEVQEALGVRAGCAIIVALPDKSEMVL
jgi:hypothetical protein